VHDVAAEITALSLNYNEDTLAMVGNTNSGKTKFVLIVSPTDGRQLYNLVKFEFLNNVNFANSQSILLAGTNRLYITGETY
jgi:ABC-type antimicrobial peptide transport system ATPase subunit